MAWVRGFLATHYRFDGLVVLLQAFFDESATHRGSPVTCVAGVVFNENGFTDFTNEWAPHVAGLSKPFRTSDAVSQRGAFDGWSSRRRFTLLDRLAGLTTSTREFCVIASMTQNDHTAYIAQSLRPESVPSVYVLCLATCLEMIGNLLTDRSEQVHYTFERGDENEAEAQEFLRRVSKVPAVEKLFHINGYGFEDKKTVIAPHPADLVAWEWQNNFKHITDGKNGWSSRMRILQRDKATVFVRHLGSIQMSMQAMFNRLYQSGTLG
jgi:hypothetical protein